MYKKTIISFLVLLFDYPVSTCMMSSEQETLIQYDEAINRNFRDQDVQTFLTHFKLPQDKLIAVLEQDRYGSSHRGQREFFDAYNENKQNDFYLKDQCVISRVICASRLATLITNKNYRTVTVPKKYLFLNKPENHLISAAERVVPATDKELIIDPQQMREFCDIATEIYFKDYNKGNFLVDKDKKIVFTDTELASFEHSGQLKSYSLNQLKRFLLPESGACYFHEVKINIPEESENYLCDLIAKSDDKTQIIQQSFPQKKEYDKQDLKISTVWPIIDSWSRDKRNSDSVLERILYPFEYMQ